MRALKSLFLMGLVGLPTPLLGIEELTEITILASRERLQAARAGLQEVTAVDLAESRVLTVNEALRKLPGLFARDEEGLGLRPNLGIRGLNPTRSAKILLLEDGLPLTFAPYGDNATYFHPALERFERIELLKNSGQIAFGPQTIGGIINYISAPTPERRQGRLTARAGNLGLRALDLEIGDTLDASGTGWRLDATHKRSFGSRDNIELDVGDAGLKVEQDIGERQSLTLRANAYRERSQVPYSGLTVEEYRRAPRANPFIHDFFDVDREAVSLVHGLKASSSTTLRTAIYHTRLQRDWWRQSSNSRQRPNDASDPGCGGMGNLSAGCGNEGRNRFYTTFGVEPRLQHSGQLDNGIEYRALVGLRHHREYQHRLQLNGDTPWARSAGTGINGGVREDNVREVAAESGFIELTVNYGRLSITPGVRYEQIRFDREDRLRRTAGSTSLTELIPGISIQAELDEGLALFGGVHRGFAPPRVEDVIGSSGASVELDPELSWNRELGLRWSADVASGAATHLEVAVFDMDFSNQIIPASLAGGVGATLTNGGSTRHRGIEVLGEWRGALASAVQPKLRFTSTWLREARFLGERYSSIDARQRIDGRRLPYAAEFLATLTMGAVWQNGLSLQLEGHYVGAMFTDDLNSVPLSADGQRGRIDGHVTWNVTANYHATEQLAWFAGVKNLTDRLYIADLSRGIVPGPPRQLQAGFEYRF